MSKKKGIILCCLLLVVGCALREVALRVSYQLGGYYLGTSGIVATWGIRNLAAVCALAAMVAALVAGCFKASRAVVTAVAGVVLLGGTMVCLGGVQWLYNYYRITAENAAPFSMGLRSGCLAFALGGLLGAGLGLLNRRRSVVLSLAELIVLSGALIGAEYLMLSRFMMGAFSITLSIGGIPALTAMLFATALRPASTRKEKKGGKNQPFSYLEEYKRTMRKEGK